MRRGWRPAFRRKFDVDSTSCSRLIILSHVDVPIRHFFRLYFHEVARFSSRASSHSAKVNSLNDFYSSFLLALYFIYFRRSVKSFIVTHIIERPRSKLSFHLIRKSRDFGGFNLLFRSFCSFVSSKRSQFCFVLQKMFLIAICVAILIIILIIIVVVSIPK